MTEKSYKIDFEIYVVFIIVIGISVFNAIYSSINISGNQEVTGKIMSSDVPSLQRMEQMNLLVTRSKMYTTNWVYLPSSKDDKEKLRLIHAAEYPALKQSIATLTSKWKDKAEADSTLSVLGQFEELMVYEKQVMSTLVRFDDYEDPMKRFAAEEILENQVLPQSARIIDKLNIIIQQRKTKAEFRFEEVKQSSRMMMWSLLGMAILIVLVILVAAFYISNNIIVPTMKLRNYVLQMGKGEIPEMKIKPGKNAIGQMTEAVGVLAQSLKKTTAFAHDIGGGNFFAHHEPLSKNDELGNALIQMRESLKQADDENRQRTWISTGMERINEVIRENNDDLGKLADGIIGTLSRYVNATQGALYLVDDNNPQIIRLHGVYASDKKPSDGYVIRRGEGLIGQAIKDGQQVYLDNGDNPSGVIKTGIGSVTPTNIVVVPLKIHGIVYGAVELYAFKSLDKFQMEFIRLIGQTIGSTITSVRANMLTKRLLDETRLQAERLQEQEEQLIKTNEELSHQSKLLQESEEELKARNKELQSNTRELEHKNEVLEQAREALSIKAKELEMNNKFKSEFLANMSHELRTPLNSVLILAKLLSEKDASNLTSKQIEYAKVIHKSGSDLLTLINDILDLSKIEAGKIEMVPERTSIQEIAGDLRMLFDQVAESKSIQWNVDVDKGLPDHFVTDKLRLEQVLKNLLSNAFKFTPEAGSVSLKFKVCDRSQSYSNPDLYRYPSVLCISVTDTGIGISMDKQALIFEPFQQADGSTSRKYGGTGLGLSISKMLISLLGGEMALHSEVGKGSCFSILIPLLESDKTNNVSRENTGSASLLPYDDRLSIFSGDRVVLIAVDNEEKARSLVAFAREQEYKSVVAKNRTQVFSTLTSYRPESIVLSTTLSGEDGMDIFRELKMDSRFKNIPVHLIAEKNLMAEEVVHHVGGFLKKPLDKRDFDEAFRNLNSLGKDEINRILLVEDVIIHQDIIRSLLADSDRKVDLSAAKNVKEAEQLLSATTYDCIVLDLDLGNGAEEAYRFLIKLKSEARTVDVPVIVFTAQDLYPEWQRKINELSSVIVKKTPETFETVLELAGQLMDEGNEEKTPVIPQSSKELLSGKIVLLVDDDMRNIYALTSLMEAEDMVVVPAVNGKDALVKAEKMQSAPHIILMDIMMPEMDGYEAIRKLRTIKGFEKVPVVVITAKAMNGDKEKCLQAGVSDYISKPMIADKLFAIMRLWLYKQSI